MSGLGKIHPSDVPLFIQVLTVGREVARKMGLDLKNISPHPNPHHAYTEAQLGSCTFHGEIRIVFRYINNAGNWLGPVPIPEIWDTLAHELAHIRFDHHRSTFWDYYKEVKKVVRNTRSH